MIIDISIQDIWNEFVHYRKAGRAKLAFDHIRVRGTKSKFEAMLAGIAYRNYNPQLGDIIISGPNSEYEFLWDHETEKAFYNLKTDLFDIRRPILTPQGNNNQHASHRSYHDTSRVSYSA